MKKRSLLVSLLLVALLIPTMLLGGCGKEDAPLRFSAYSLDYFDTATTVTGYAKDQAEFDRVSGEILAELAEYHRLFTIYHRFDGMENLCTVNQLTDGVHRTVTVDRRIIDLLLYAKEVYQKTGGTVNIAMGSVLSIWHDYRTRGLNDPASAQLPPTHLLEEAAKHTSIEDLVIDEENQTVYLADPHMRLDVGAIAKGYAVEMVARGLEAIGITGYVLNVGGNVRTVGTKGDGNPWVAGIENPEEDESLPYLTYLSLTGESVVTSGSYQRYYLVGGVSYHHIIDPKTLMPAQGFRSVSVICRDSAAGDALSTALFCLSREEGLAVLRAFGNAEAIWVLPDGTQLRSDGFSAYETTLDG